MRTEERNQRKTRARVLLVRGVSVTQRTAVGMSDRDRTYKREGWAMA
jgi:hypothetical protein